MSIMTWDKSREETLGLPIDALALLILRDYKASNGWNWQNWMWEAEQHGTARDPHVIVALAEGWAWLMTHGLVVRDPSQQSPDALRSEPTREADSSVWASPTSGGGAARGYDLAPENRPACRAAVLVG